MDQHPHDGLTLGELADLEDRTGQRLTRSVVMSNPEALEAFKRTARVIGAKMGAMVKHWGETYSEEFAYVDSQPPWKRQRYEHMTMPEIRRAMRRSANGRPMARRREHVSSRRRRRATRRTRSVRSGNDPPGEPPAQRRARYLYAVLTPEQRGDA